MLSIADDTHDIKLHVSNKGSNEKFLSSVGETKYVSKLRIEQQKPPADSNTGITGVRSPCDGEIKQGSNTGTEDNTPSSDLPSRGVVFVWILNAEVPSKYEGRRPTN